MNDLISRAAAVAAAVKVEQPVYPRSDASETMIYSIGFTAGRKAVEAALHAIPAASQPEAETVLLEVIEWAHRQPGNYPDWIDRARKAVGQFDGDAGQPEAEPVAWAEVFKGGKIASIRLARDEYRTVPLYAHPSPAPVVPAEGLADYDAGLLNDFGGGDVGWWQDYLRAEIDRANEFWREQVENSALRAQQPAAPVSGVTVKPLVWKQAGGNIKAGEGYSAWSHLSFAPTTTYLTHAGWWLSADSKTYPTLEAAKAAAQAHHEARILSALEGK